MTVHVKKLSSALSLSHFPGFRYLLRLGMGEQELATEMDFSRVGRVNAMLARRLELLAEVGSLKSFLTRLTTACMLVAGLQDLRPALHKS